MAKIPEQPG